MSCQAAEAVQPMEAERVCALVLTEAADRLRAASWARQGIDGNLAESAMVGALAA